MTLSLRANLPVDDTDPNILYSAGDWQEQTGSSRQFDSDVHLTSNYGATISFRYNGQAFIIYGTIPVGSNNVIFDVSIDGGSPTTVTKACDSDEQFAVDLFESPVVDFAVHTVVITNRGRSTDASFMFDELLLFSNDINPSMASPPTLTTTTSIRTTSQELPQSVPSPTSPSTHVSQTSSSSGTTSSTTTTSVSSSSQTSTGSASVSNSSAFTTTTSESITTFLSTDSRGSTVLFTQTFTTSFLASSQTGSAAAIANPSHIGTVMAGVFGGLVFLLLTIVAFLVLRRRRKNTRALLDDDERGLVLKKSRNGKPSIIPQPFRLSTPRRPTSPETSPTLGQSPTMSEKSGHRKYNASNENHSSEPESAAGPSFSNQDPFHTPLNQNPSRGFSSAAQSDSAANILSHRRSTSMANAVDEEIPHSPTMSSMYMSSVSGHTYDAPPAYQPPATGTRTSDFKTRSQLYNDHPSRPPGDPE